MSGYLIDTHVLIWWSDNAHELRDEARLILASARNSVFLSHVSLWEIAIAQSRGRVRLSNSLSQLTTRSRFTPLPIAISHLEQVATLPFHHRDPFDRLLVAQAQVERLTLITRDRELAKYDVPTLAA